MDSYDIKEISALLKLISETNRLKILYLLQKREHCVCELIKETKLSQSLISHHLKDLKDINLVSKRIESKWSHYSLTPKGQKITKLIFKLNL
ncbi:MAG: metalloregulator ArsR/SmtB family transcription factor [Candidatus Shapirobacteria bacterium]|nr:metalloregulator ArsR/SmtB family transcription factor [Candidatus Shapirobacteria bacterium]